MKIVDAMIATPFIVGGLYFLGSLMPDREEAKSADSARPAPAARQVVEETYSEWEMPHRLSELPDEDKRKLTLFGTRALGVKAGLADIKNLLPADDIEEMVANGLNLNGMLCAEVVSVRRLKQDGLYVVDCALYRDGRDGYGTYVVSVTTGNAWELTERD